MMRLLLSSVWYELVFLRRSPGKLMPLVTVPLFAAAFLSITQYSQRPDLAGYAVIGSAVITIWSSAVYLAGELIDLERWQGTLEAIVSTPAPLAVVVVGRITTITGVSFLGMFESVLVARFGFRVPITVHHPGLFAATLAAAAVAMIGTSAIMSGLFVLARSVRTFQNSLTYPFYLLSGAVVPIALLPSWLHPFSRLIFLSWVADLLRVSLQPADPPGVATGLVMTLLLGGCGYAVGFWGINRILWRLRHLGTVGQA